MNFTSYRVSLKLRGRRMVEVRKRRFARIRARNISPQPVRHSKPYPRAMRNTLWHVTRWIS